MRSASFFILSLTLHIGALLYPVSFRDRLEEPFFPVTILLSEPGPANETNGGSGERPASLVKSNVRSMLPRVAKPAPEFTPVPSRRQRQAISAEPVTTASESAVIVASFSQTLDSESATIDGSTISAESIGVELLGSGGEGHSRGDFGSGSGQENGQSDSPGATITQARYRETPAPLYPESARRDGREGRVLLRVLVDDQGRAKTVEVSTSSGNEVLDRAAAEAIRHWRFHPARYAKQPVESWIRIPIEFRLASANP
jgi:protein TonB